MAKRLTSSNVRWSYIMESLSRSESSRLIPLKTASEKYLREIATKPAELPKLDWNLYKNRISVPGMVETFQKGYESLKIPYPSDQGVLAESEKQNAELMQYANKTHEEVVQKTKELKTKLEKLESVLKYSEMSLEELLLAKPEFKLYDEKNPKYFPQFVKDPPDAKKREDH